MKSPKTPDQAETLSVGSLTSGANVEALVGAAAPFVDECRRRRAALDELSSKRGSLPADLRAARQRSDNARQQAERERAAANARRIARIEFDPEPLANAEQEFELAASEAKRLEDMDAGIVGAIELLREDLDAAHDRLDAELRPLRQQLQADAIDRFRRAVADLRDAAELLRAMNEHVADSDFSLPKIDPDALPFQFQKASTDVMAIAEAVRPVFWEQHRSLQRLLRM